MTGGPRRWVGQGDVMGRTEYQDLLDEAEALERCVCAECLRA